MTHKILNRDPKDEILKVAEIWPKKTLHQKTPIKWKTLLKWMIWGYHYFRKHPHMYYIHIVFYMLIWSLLLMVQPFEIRHPPTSWRKLVGVYPTKYRVFWIHPIHPRQVVGWLGFLNGCHQQSNTCDTPGRLVGRLILDESTPPHLGGCQLQTHPTWRIGTHDGRKWLITMVIVSPLNWGYSPSKSPNLDGL